MSTVSRSVSSAASDEVLRFDADNGEFIDTFVSAGSGGLDRPTRMVFGPDDNLYVSSIFSDEVLRYDANGNFVDAFVPAGSGGLSDPLGLAFEGYDDFGRYRDKLYFDDEGKFAGTYFERSAKEKFFRTRKKSF